MIPAENTSTDGTAIPLPKPGQGSVSSLVPDSTSTDTTKVPLPSTAVNTLPGVPETPAKELEDAKDSSSAVVVAPEKKVIPENAVRTTLKLGGNFADF